MTAETIGYIIGQGIGYSLLAYGLYLGYLKIRPKKQPEVTE